MLSFAILNRPEHARSRGDKHASNADILSLRIVFVIKDIPKVSGSVDQGAQLVVGIYFTELPQSGCHMKLFNRGESHTSVEKNQFSTYNVWN